MYNINQIQIFSFFHNSVLLVVKQYEQALIHGLKKNKFIEKINTLTETFRYVFFRSLLVFTFAFVSNTRLHNFITIINYYNIIRIQEVIVVVVEYMSIFVVILIFPCSATFQPQKKYFTSMNFFFY